MKKFLSLFLCLALIVPLEACSKKNTNETKPTNETKVTNENKSTQDELKAKGYKVYKDLGLAFKLGDVWKKCDNNVSLGGIGDSENADEPIYGGLSYSFLSNELIKEYNDVKQNEKDEAQRKKKINEIWSKAKPVLSLVVFRKEKMPNDAVSIAKLTELKHNDKITEVDKFVFYISYNDYDDSGLSDEAKSMYKSLWDDVANIKNTLVCSKPITPKEAFQNIGKIEFKLKDLDGKDVNSEEIFKKYKVTMINIWGTFCGPCIKEMPDLQLLYKEMEPQGVNLIGIIGDTPDPDNEALAKKIYKEKKLTFMSIIPDKAFKDKVISSIAGYPTTIFVNSEGKIIGEVLTGSRGKEDYKKVIDEILNKK